MEQLQHNKNIHWYDLDGVLWQTDAKWWIVDKMSPSKPIIKISQYEGSLILSGHYRSDNIFVSYNGHEGYLSKEMFLKIQSKKNISKEDIGFNWREFTDSKIIEKQAEYIIFNIKYISHLKDTEDDVKLLTARGNKDAHDILLNKLNGELSGLNILISDSIFINDIKFLNITGSTSVKKTMCILQSMVGYEIHDDKFVPISVEKYDCSYFYDDEDKNIEQCKLMNTHLLKLLENTMPSLRSEILEDVRMRQPKLIINLVTTNEENMFITNEVIITG